MSFIPPTQMGYDRAITMFSPEGKLYQVEYAFEAVKKGWNTLGIKCKEGVLIAVEKKKVQELLDIEHLDKIFMIDEHIITSFAGLAADGRVLVDYARTAALRYRFTYDEPAPVEFVARAVSDLKQAYTQHGGVRPFGVALIIAGVDDTPKLFMTEPSGQYMSYMAVAIGQNHSTIIQILEEKYRYDMTLDEAIKLALYALIKATETKREPQFYEIAIVPADTKVARKVSEEEIANYLKEI